MKRSLDIQKVSLTAKPIKFEAINSDFTKAKCYVMALGKNRNLSHFTKEAVDDAMPTLGLIPVVAHIIRDPENDKTYVGGHDREITLEGQNLYVEDLTVPFGVVVPDTYEYVDVEENDGTVATYLTADIVIWSGRYPEIMDTIYSDDIYWNQSMEVIPEIESKLKEDKNYTDIQKFRYSCLTLLGKDDDPEYNTVPCFPSARVEPYDFNFTASNNFTTEFSEMMDRLKAVFSYDLNSDRGEKMEEIKKDSFEENEEIQIEEVSPEEDVSPEEETFAASYIEKIEAVSSALQELDISETTTAAYHYFVDMDDEFVFYAKLEYTNIDIDGKCDSSTKLFKAPYSLTKDGTQFVVEINVDAAIEMVQMLLTVEEAEAIEKDRAELSRLQQFEAEYFANERQKRMDGILDEFSDLSDNVEFIELITNNELEPDEIEEKCFAIRGRNMKASFSAKKTQNTSNNIKIPATKEDADTDDHQPEPYGGLFINHKINL